jgi:hypothetical protein
MPTRRTLLALAPLALAAACGKKDDLSEAPVDLGDFALGLAVVVADNAKKVPISRPATPDEWEAVLKTALEARFRRYEATGTKLYNIGIAVDGYALAPPGIPIVAAPKSILVTSVALFDDAAGEMINPDGKGFQISAFERGGDGSGLLGSGLTRTKEEQMAELAYVTVLRIETWLRDNRTWFGLPPPRPGRVRY